MVAGAEGGRETSSPYRQRFDLTTVPTTNLLHPDTSQPFAGIVPGTGITDTHVTAISAGAYALDTVNLLPKLDLTAGVRVDRFDATVDQSLPVTPDSPFKRVDVMPSWRGALVFKPVAGGSIYFDYGTSFNPSAETLALSVATQNAPPEQSRTFEVGTKWDLFARKLSLRAAAFRTDKTNARETVNATTVVLSGSQRVSGVQIQANGYITSRWELLASYAYLDGKGHAVAGLPAIGWRATGQRSPEHVQHLEHLRPALAPERWRRRGFCRQPHRQFDHASRSRHRIW